MNKGKGALTLMVLLVLAGALALFSQQPVRLVNRGGDEVVVGAQGGRYDSGLTTMPGTDTVLTTNTTWVQFLHCGNTTGGAVTFTMKDNQGTPKAYFTAVSVPANGVLTGNYGSTGMRFDSGIRWNASATTSLNCQVIGVQ